jgi:hypothetical protein
LKTFIIYIFLTIFFNKLKIFRENSKFPEYFSITGVDFITQNGNIVSGNEEYDCREGDNDCSNRGECNLENGVCICQKHFHGHDCAQGW